MTILDSIPYPEELDEETYNQYFLLKIQAKYKSYRDITSDSTILSVQNYYLKKKDDPAIALSSYYCGCYYKERDENKKALEYFHLALKYAEIIDSFALKSLINSDIGLVLLDQFDTASAMSYFRESAFCDLQTGNLKNEVISYVQIGDCFQYLEQPDSALHYYMKGMHLIGRENWPHEQSDIRQNLGILYAKKGNLTKAVSLLKDALTYTPSIDDQIKIYVSLLDLYTLGNQQDSAKIYCDYLLQRKDSIKDLYVRAYLFDSLSKREKLLGNYAEALNFHNIYVDNLLQAIDTRLDDRLLELQKKYDYEKVHSHNIRLKLERTNLWIGLICILLLLSIIIWFLFRKYNKRKKELEELEEKIIQLNNLAEKYNQKEKTFTSYLLKHFNILKKVSILKIYTNKNQSHKDEFWVKKFNEIVYGQDSLDWSTLYDVMNELHNNFFIKLKNLYPQLKDTEFRILCLTYSGFSTEEIAIVLNLSLNTINTRRSAIRKSIGIPAFANLRDFLNDKLN